MSNTKLDLSFIKDEKLRQQIEKLNPTSVQDALEKAANSMANAEVKFSTQGNYVTKNDLKAAVDGIVSNVSQMVSIPQAKHKAEEEPELDDLDESDPRDKVLKRIYSDLKSTKSELAQIKSEKQSEAHAKQLRSQFSSDEEFAEFNQTIYDGVDQDQGAILKNVVSLHKALKEERAKNAELITKVKTVQDNKNFASPPPEGAAPLNTAKEAEDDAGEKLDENAKYNQELKSGWRKETNT